MFKVGNMEISFPCIDRIKIAMDRGRMVGRMVERAAQYMFIREK